MRPSCLIVLVSAMLWSAMTAALAENPGTETRAAVREVIEQQLDAFHRDDAAEAFSFAAPSIRELFETSDRFIQMVERGYAPLMRSEQPVFVQSRTTDDGVVLQEIGFVGPEGKSWSAFYALERQPDGTWKISGCVLKPAKTTRI